MNPNAASSLGASAPEYNALRVQTSTQGMVIPVVFGTTRISGNLIWANEFQSIPHASGTTGGKGGLFGGTGTGGTVEYTYSVSFEIGLCEGPIAGIGKCWRDKVIYNTPPPDLTIFLGTYTQLAWSHIGATYTATETFDIPASPYQVTVKHASLFLSDISAISQAYSSDPNVGTTYTPFTKVSGSPSAGQYSVSNGVYTFNSTNSGEVILISYTWGLSPLQALAYPGIAYVASPNYDLGKSDALPNMTFEIQGLNIIGGGIVDANPADIISAIITNSKFGLGLSSSYLDVSDYSTWCLAANLLLSPVFNSQQPAADQIQQILDETFSTAIWHDCSTLKIVPYGDTQQVGNGQTWTPDLTPIYDLTDDDFLGDRTKDPIKVTRKSPADLYNNQKVEYLDRNNEYNPSIAEFMDQGSIDAYMLRQYSTHQMHDICDASIASHLVQLIGQRGLYVANEYEFTLGWAYCLLEPMDVVTLTDSVLGLNKYPVRIISIEEDENGDLTVITEDFPQGVGHAALYPRQTNDGFNVNYNVDPGNVNTPIIFTAPANLAGQNEVWIALSGGSDWGGADVYISSDGSTYKFLQRVLGASRYGFISAELYNHSDPDSVDTLSVDLTPSRGQLLSGTQADADNLVTLCMVGSELLSYETATMTGTFKYDLTYLRRGQMGTKSADHPVNWPFVRLDENVVRVPIDYVYAGSTFYLKFCSFNTWQSGVQELSDVTAYQVEIPMNATLPLNSGTDGYANTDSGIYYHTYFQSLSELEMSANGVSVGTNGLVLQSGTNANNQRNIYAAIPKYSFTLPSWNKNRRIKARMMISSPSNSASAWIVTGGTLPVNVNLQHFGFHVTGLTNYINGHCGDGNNASSETSLCAFSANVYYNLEAILNVSQQVIQFYVNGNMLGSLNTHIPAANDYAQYFGWLAMIKQDDSSPFMSMTVSEFLVQQDP